MRRVPPRPPPRRSLARPARLIWPTRTADASAGQAGEVRVTVDTDGIVVGVRTLPGRTSSADRRAADAVWRFRYDPARDADGRPVRSTFMQAYVLRR
ncbi:MAG: hypothetical protein R3B06_30410 [Kofleriaceae bacterium]